MRASRFDIVIAGDSLAGRMAAALLVKHGKRLLFLASPPCQDPWLHSSLFVERLLGILGGRECFVPRAPFQVLSSRARVTIHPKLPFGNELTREFGHAAAAVISLLAEAEHTGNQLEELLLEHGGLPSGGWRETARWRWLCLRRKLSLSGLEAPLIERCRNLPAPAVEWLRDLFQGLSLKPVEALTMADGALLWARACRPEGVEATALNQLLKKRFEQFHGVEARLEDVLSLEHQQGQWQGTMQDGGHFRSHHLVFGDLGHDFPGRGFPLRSGFPAPDQHFLTSALDGRLSPLLERRVIAGGPLPMRMVLKTSTTGLTGQIGTSADADEIQVRRQFEPVLPFARYTLDRHMYRHTNDGHAGVTVTCPSLFRVPLRLGSHLWCADETRLLPHLDIGGAAMLAWTLVRHLDPQVITQGS